MYGEAQAAESRDDFVHKMKVLPKELKETRACLKLIIIKEMIKAVQKLHPMQKENEELIAIVAKSIKQRKEITKNK
jgi:four helix bundle protein